MGDLQAQVPVEKYGSDILGISEKRRHLREGENALRNLVVTMNKSTWDTDVGMPERHAKADPEGIDIRNGGATTHTALSCGKPAPEPANQPSEPLAIPQRKTTEP